jgi:hypothetical protein
VVDWAGHDGMRTAARYRGMVAQVHGISPSYERLCAGIADDGELIGRLETLPRPKRQPNLLFGAVRYHDGPVESYGAFRDYVLSCWDLVAETMLTRRTQTNEPRRCATLLPALAALPQPLALLEVGASAGLCLHPDRYAYRYDGGGEIGSSPVVFDCATRSAVPVPTALPTVTWRAGLDLHPLDVHSADDVRWLRALIWPEQSDRFALLDQAVEVARREYVEVRQGDLTRDLVELAAAAPQSATLVVYHSAVLAYLDDADRLLFREQLADVRESRRLVWLSNEGPGVVVDVPVTGEAVPFVLARDGVPVALTGPHGEWVQWLT